MTSKQALEEFAKEFGCDLAYYNLQNEYDIIKKDLEVLEIVRQHKLLNYVLKNKKCSDRYQLSDEEINLIKEWFNNDIRVNNTNSSDNNTNIENN